MVHFVGMNFSFSLLSAWLFPRPKPSCYHVEISKSFSSPEPPVPHSCWSDKGATGDIDLIGSMH